MLKNFNLDKIHRWNMFVILSLLVLLSCADSKSQNSAWIKADLHMHTTMSDGNNTPIEVVDKALSEFSLDVIALTDHGGLWYHLNDKFQRLDESGNVIYDGKDYDSIMAIDKNLSKNYSHTLQLEKKSFPEVLKLRKLHPNKLIIQGLEWDIPGHDHGNIGINAISAKDIAIFHYLFDRNDSYRNDSLNLTKENQNIHSNSLVALKYLQKNYPDDSYFIVNHPSRKMMYKIADFRDFNNAAPGIAIGFEGIPGHQKHYNARGDYKNDLGDNEFYFSKTFGGADYILARVGGVWDAMLCEGRRFWVYASSDYHREHTDFWPGEYAFNYVRMDDKLTYKSFFKNIKSGNSFITEDDLIDYLDFNVESENSNATMGEGLEVSKNSNVKITIKFKSNGKSTRGKFSKVDHVDLIIGDVTSIVNPNSNDYNKPFNNSVKVEKQFFKNDWKEEDGICQIEYSMPINNNKFIRLRGTNVPINTPNESDSHGNPLIDTMVGKNDIEKSLSDLWFYSNPIFIEIKD